MLPEDAPQLSWCQYEWLIARRALLRLVHPGVRLIVAGLASILAAAAGRSERLPYDLPPWAAAVIVFLAVIGGCWVVFFLFCEPYAHATDVQKQATDSAQNAEALRKQIETGALLPPETRQKIERIRELAGKVLQRLRHGEPIAAETAELMELGGRMEFLELEPGLRLPEVVHTFTLWADESTVRLITTTPVDDVISACNLLLQRYPRG